MPHPIRVPTISLGVACLTTLVATSIAGAAEAPLLQEDFAGGKVPEGWRAALGDFRVDDGALVLSEKPADMHNGVLIIPRPNRDVAVSFDFRLDGAKALHLSFDVAPGTPDRKGHLFRLVLRPDGMLLQRDLDKSNPAVKGARLAEAKRAFEPGKWYTVRLEHRGPEVTASVGTDATVKASDAHLAHPKPGVRFVVTGQSARIDNIKMWDLGAKES